MGDGCSETFDDPKVAARFKTDVEYHGHQYPPNYVPRFTQNHLVTYLALTEADIATLAARDVAS